jgi:FkbM family methyltransferase
MKQTIQKLFKQLGYKIESYNFFRSHEIRRVKFMQDHDISLVLDIGANEGQYGQSIRHLGYKGKIISFEPVKAIFEKLRNNAHLDEYWQVRGEAVGDYDGETAIYISRFSQASSLLPATGLAGTEYFKTECQEKVSIHKLDSLKEELQIELNKVYLKIDCQGFEKNFLKGCCDLIKYKSFHFIELELSIETFYEGETLFIDMLTYMQEIDFEMISINPTFIDPKTGYVLQHDCIFKNKELLPS